jgi:hypothetical protein
VERKVSYSRNKRKERAAIDVVIGEQKMAELERELLAHWSAVIRDVFGPEYEFEPCYDLEYQGLRIQRPLPIAGRPSRSSRQILLRVSRFAVNGYLEGYEERRATADDRLRRFAAWKFKAFNPEHDTLEWQEVPVEKWDVESELLLGRANPVFDEEFS